MPLFKDFNPSQRLLYIISGCLIFAYAILQIYPFFSNALVPDEIWFNTLSAEKVKLIHQYGILSFIYNQQNDLGYGAFYWILNALLLLISGSIWPIKCIAFICVISIPTLFLIKGWMEKSSSILPCILIWLIMPMAWWYGKILSPELITLALGVLALTLTTRPNQTIGFMTGWVIAGVMLGTKLNTLPIAVYIILWNILYEKIPAKRLILAMFAIAFGFLLANPFIIFHQTELITNLSEASGEANTFGINKIYTMFFNQQQTWDLVDSSGFFYLGLSVWASILYLFLLFFLQVPKKIIACLGLTFLATIAMLYIKKSFWGWYWFPFFVLIPFSMLFAKKKITALTQLIIIVLLCSLSVFSIKKIIFGYQFRSEHIANIKAAPALQQWIIDQTRQSEWMQARYFRILDLSEFGANLSFHPKTYEKIEQYYDAFDFWFVKSTPIKTNQPILIILGDRFTKFKLYKNLRNALESGQIERNGQTFIVAHKTHQQFVSIFVLLPKS